MLTRRAFLPLAAALAAAAPATRKTKHVVLFTSDGVRWQDLFTGIDPKLMGQKQAGISDARALEKALWRDTPGERREALMPFF